MRKLALGTVALYGIEGGAAMAADVSPAPGANLQGGSGRARI